MTDTALFPITAAERVAKARLRLEAALERAERRVEKAQEKVAAAELELEDFDAAILAIRSGDE
jgi:hypothetical protein